MFSKPSSVVLLLLSAVAAACNSPGTEPPAPAPKAAVTVVKALPPAAVSVTQPVVAAVASPPATPAPKSASKATGLTVKRFVVASAISDREPVKVESVALGELPLFAFAELANGGEADKIAITFELDGEHETVGHVELTVPAETKRWRTWGKTNLIAKPGHWSAVLRDQSGKELARTPFEVTKLTSEGDSRIGSGVMKLLTSPTSPFGRKVRIVLLEKGLPHEVANPWSADAGLVLDRHNPLGKVPALVLSDGTTLFDSVVIAEYVDTLSDAPRLNPGEPRERALVRRWEALADGIMESTVAIMLEGRRPEAQRSSEAIAKQLGKVRASLAFVERELGEKSFAHGGDFSLADAALVSALGYLDLRLASEPWREQHPALARYGAALAKRVSVAETVPPKG